MFYQEPDDKIGDWRKPMDVENPRCSKLIYGENGVNGGASASQKTGTIGFLNQDLSLPSR